MALTNKYRRIPLDQIYIARDDRQRREIDTTDIDDSIKQRGVIQPVLVEWSDDRQLYVLLAGERRFTSSQKQNIPDIPARLASGLTEIERQIFELEENVKRKDLPWKDEVLAVRKIHYLYIQQNLDKAEDNQIIWTIEGTAREVGMSAPNVSMMISVADELIANNKLVHDAPGFRPAYNIIQRHEGRRIDDAMNDLLADGLDPVATEENIPPVMIMDMSILSKEDMATLAAELKNPTPGSIITIPPKAMRPMEPPQPESIVQTDFVKWSDHYAGKPFSFLHCDFPYGLDLDKSEQANSKAYGGYEDSEATYWKLCTALCKNLDRVMMQSAHMMFWCSADARMVTKTLDFFETHAPSLSFVPVPLIWHKTDGKGILSDHRRRARHIYETCLVASRGDRHIIKSVGDTYGAPTAKELHQSEKPEPVLRHFMAMFVDENTRMLDPTCGSASSLRSAESLGASYVFGLEINPDFISAARTALRRSRLLRASSTPAKPTEVKPL